jgi:MFS family permease
MPDPHLQQPASTTEPAGSRRYRFWPVYAAAFTRTLSYTIYGLALPNYLIYFLHVPEWLYGVIIAVYSIAYIAGPLVAMPVTRRIGARNGTMISVVGSILLVSCQLVLLDPWALVLLRAVDGFLLGFFWPNIQMEVSSWQRAIPEKNDGQFFQTYGMSWNIGIILGDIGGFFIVFLGAGNEYLALLLSWLAMLSMLPCVLAMERPGTGIVLRGTAFIAVAAPLVQPARAGRGAVRSSDVPVSVQFTRQEEKEKVQPMMGTTKYLLSFSAAFYLVGTLIYAYMKAFYPFVYPLALSNAGIPSYVVYLVTFFHQAVQTVIIIIWTRKSVKAGYYAWAAAMVANVAFLLWLWLVADPVLLTVAFIANGVLSGWLYTFTSKIMLEYGAVENSLKYATYYEFFNGIGFGVAPLIAGAMASIDPNLNNFITAILVAAFCVLLFLGSARAATNRKRIP